MNDVYENNGSDTECRLLSDLPVCRILIEQRAAIQGVEFDPWVAEAMALEMWRTMTTSQLEAASVRHDHELEHGKDPYDDGP